MIQTYFDGKLVINNNIKNTKLVTYFITILRDTTLYSIHMEESSLKAKILVTV